MKIAHIIPSLIPGGAQRVTVTLAREAALSGHGVRVFVGWPDSNDGVLRDAIPQDIPVEFVFSSQPSRVKRFLMAAHWVFRNRGRIAELDIVHCHLTFGSVAGALISVMRRTSRPALVETYHSVTAVVPRLQVAFHRALASTRDALVLHADDSAWLSFTRHHPKIIVRTIQNGVEKPKVIPITESDRMEYRRQVGIPDDCTLLVGTVGRLEVDRRPWTYVAIFAEISRLMGPGVHFLLAGGGPELANVESLVAAEGLSDRVHITGAFRDSQLPLSIMDLYIAMNLGETTGLAGLEAALSGLPSVAIQLDPEYRMPVTDWVWSSADNGAIARKVVELLRDPAQRSDLGSRQQAHVREHRTVTAMWREYEKLYKDVLRRREGSTAA